MARALQARADLELLLLDFVGEHSASLDPDTTFQLLDSHGHADVKKKRMHTINRTRFLFLLSRLLQICSERPAGLFL